MSSGTQPWEGFVADGVPPLSAEQLHFFGGKRVLVTGAGGFIGSALARAFAGVSLETLVLLDTAEYGLYRLEQHIEGVQPLFPALTILGSVSDAGLLEDVFGRHRPQIVFHAAALKHVPLLEANALAAAETNALGTRTMLRAAERWGVERFVLLSTDKAVEPISVMGRTKRVAELLTMAAAEREGGEAVYTAVRLCNVLGSTGSVAPLFARQVAQGGPVTVTHPEATRYFISLRDAVQYLLRAAMASGSAAIVAPKVGPARAIRELAEYLIAHGSSEAAKVEIAYTALRQADKLHEVFVGPGEIATARDGDVFLQVEGPALQGRPLERVLEEVSAAVRDRNTPRLLLALRGATQASVPGDGADGDGVRAIEEVGR